MKEGVLGIEVGIFYSCMADEQLYLMFTFLPLHLCPNIPGGDRGGFGGDRDRGGPGRGLQDRWIVVVDYQSGK